MDLHQIRLRYVLKIEDEDIKQPTLNHSKSSPASHRFLEPFPEATKQLFQQSFLLTMARFSHIVVSIITILALLSSIFTISFSLSLIRKGPTECNDPNPIKLLLYGVFLFSLSLVGLIGAIRANRRSLSVYAGGLVLWFFWLIGSSAFLLVLSKVSDAKAEKDNKEYKLNEYPGWLRRYVMDGDRWVPIKRCMVRHQTCKNLHSEKETAGKRNLHIESCCQPPLQCGFVSKNETSREVPKSGILSGDPDCQSWRNKLDQMCYDCNSCKAGYLRMLKDSWFKKAISGLLFCVVIFVGFWIAFWAFRQAPREDNFHQLTGNQGWSQRGASRGGRPCKENKKPLVLHRKN